MKKEHVLKAIATLFIILVFGSGLLAIWYAEPESYLQWQCWSTAALFALPALLSSFVFLDDADEEKTE